MSAMRRPSWDKGFHDGFCAQRANRFDHSYDDDPQYLAGYAAGLEAGRSNVEYYSAGVV